MKYTKYLSEHNIMKLDQWQKENWKIHKYVEIKYDLGQPMNTKRYQKEIRKYLETNKNTNKIYQNFCDAAKAGLKEKSVHQIGNILIRS